MKCPPWQYSHQTCGTRLCLAVMVLLCGLAGWSGAQPHSADRAGGSGFSGHWEHFSQGIPSEKLSVRLGAKDKTGGRGLDGDGVGQGSGQTAQDSFTPFWVAGESSAARIASVSATRSPPAIHQAHVRHFLKQSPHAARAPPFA